MAGKAKPVGSLGVMEAMACRLAALQGTLEPRIGRASLLVFGADHGITAARPQISAFPRAVSAPVFRAVARGQAASAVLCAANGVSLLVAVDVGLDADVTDACPPPPPPVLTAGREADSTRISVVHRKIRPGGSRNMLEGPAMTEQEVADAMAAGSDAVQMAVRGTAGPGAGGGALADGGGPADRGPGPLPDDWRQCVVCIGEVGIGNTTAAAALVAALSGAAPEDVCGRGTGVDDTGLAAKREAVSAALAANAELLRGGGALGALRAVGGLELAAMAGAVVACAELGVPVVADGFISGAAALAALAHQPGPVGRCLFLSHRSAERGAALLLAALTGAVPLAPHIRDCQAAGPQPERPPPQRDGGRESGPCAAAAGSPDQGPAETEAAGVAAGAAAAAWPSPAVLDMGLRLGEGTGAVLVLPLLRSAAAILGRMASLEEVLAA
ncbi:hypothetical protein GPECTOR_217g454 [Gonium pectorale]|uniref:Nicotinate-nucleotide--dimethylbenzimidazole phosphoribosyltransferase n=1 Tax=Gonium pectorale TaxID=33097 RepID=A0A150FWU0_GONPE|nr:hypothetical protein GPECTOR_217g454 [Gonium pectorale]|eukprot:KXZ42047.1 hypothetical protein GPECTOR_217g454 [Gonium pectorale]